MNAKIKLLDKYGPWCLVTGASSGIGLAYTRFLAQSGFNCIIISNELDNLAAVEAEIRTRFKVDVVSLAVELSDNDAVDKIMRAVGSHEVGLVVNNAGYGIMGYFIQHSLEDYFKMIMVNEETTLSMMHIFCKRFFHAKRKGAIINVTSVNANLLDGIPFSAVYSAGKSMLKNITEAVYYEMKPFQIDVLNVAPGPTNTSFQDSADTKRLFFMESPENVVQRSFVKLGKSPNVITNPVSKILVFVHNHILISNRLRTMCRAVFFSRILGKWENIKLPSAPV